MGDFWGASAGITPKIYIYYIFKRLEIVEIVEIYEEPNILGSVNTT